MYKIKMADWVGMYEKEKEGKLHITDIILDKDNCIDCLVERMYYSKTLESWGWMTTKYLNFIRGNKQFVLEDDGTISLVIDCDEKIKVNVSAKSVEYKHKKIIPFKKWFNDIAITNNNFKKNKDDKITNIVFDGASVNSNGIITRVNATIYFGGVRVADWFDVNKILKETYGLSRDNDFEEFDGYLDEDYNVVFNDDGLYHKQGVGIYKEMYAKIS